MREGVYEFDPTSLDDGHEYPEGTVTLDNWKPKAKVKKLVTSEWRRNKIGRNYDQQPSLDDLNKIKMHLKQNYPDFEIMEHFGISSDVLTAIKKDRYCPSEGIKLDTYEKILKELDRFEDKILLNTISIKYFVKELCQDKNKLKEYNQFCKEKLKNNSESVRLRIEGDE